MKQSALTIPTLVTDQGHDTATALVIIVLALVGLAFWAGAELQLRRPANQERIGDTDERDAIANVIGLLDKRRTPDTDADFADLLEYRLRRRGDQRGQTDGTLLVSAVFLILFFVAIAAVA